MKKIKYIKEVKGHTVGTIVNISQTGAESAINAGVAEYFNPEKELDDASKLFKDKHIIETGHPKSKESAMSLGVDPENYDKIVGKEENKEKPKPNKEASMVFKHQKIKLAELFYEKQPIYLDDSDSFWLWNDGLKAWYRIAHDADLCNEIFEAIGVDTIESKERSEILQALKQIARRNRPIDLPKTWIQFKNGIIDIENPNVILKATPEYFTVNPIPWNIGTTAETPNIDKIFKEWVGEEHVKTLYQILAYCLLADYPMNRIFCFIGAGMNGKSKFLELLRKFIGETNVTATELDTLISSRFEVTRLYKKLICQMGETNFSEMNKTSVLKKLSGGDMIGFEYKNKTPFEDINYAKIIISTNNLPTTTDKTIGFYRRWLIIDFPNQFSEKKDILKDIPKEEYEALAFKSIGLLQELLTVKEFHNEGSIEERMKKYEDHSDPLEKFMKEFTKDAPDGYIWKFEFEKRLNEWCKENRFRQISEVGIGKKMKDKGFQQQSKQSDWFIDGHKKLLRAWVGITWDDKVRVNEKNLQDLQDLHPNPTYFHTRESELGMPVKVVKVVNGQSEKYS
jgi:P4 family phage/plasmid primase-like protien